MEEIKKTPRAKLDLVYWLLILILTLAGVVANFYLKEWLWSLRIALWLGLAGMVLILAACTTQGKKVWAFSKEARQELRKVAWPTRDETVKTTGIIAALVFVMSIILWAVDSMLLWVVSWFTR